VKKLISIGVALALLAMVVVPCAVAAYDTPDTYAKVPFAIISTGFLLLGDILDALPPDLGVPDWLGSLMGPLSEWTAGPLSWTVDMLAWGMDLGSTIWNAVAATLGMEDLPVGTVLHTVACGLFTCWAPSGCSGNLSPCP
jgi:hypothetical protein